MTHDPSESLVIFSSSPSLKKPTEKPAFCEAQLQVQRKGYQDVPASQMFSRRGPYRSTSSRARARRAWSAPLNLCVDPSSAVPPAPATSAQRFARRIFQQVTELHGACWANKHDEVKRLLEDNGNLESQDGRGNYPIHVAVPWLNLLGWASLG